MGLLVNTKEGRLRGMYYHPNPGAAGQPPLVPRHSTYATSSLVFALIGILGSWCSFGLPSFIAVVLGIAGYYESRNGQMTGQGQAIAGMILGAFVAIPMALLGIIVLFS
jgi:Domain of unknown function (DUF4190)